jgi:hypothetical protein
VWLKGHPILVVLLVLKDIHLVIYIDIFFLNFQNTGEKYGIGKS